MRLLAWFVATVVYVWLEQKEFSFSQIQLAAFIGLQRRRGRGDGKVSQTPVKGGIVSSISSFREPTTGPLWGPWRQAGTLTREERSLGKIESSCS